MTTGARAFWGAVVGALVTLVIHPSTRPFYIADPARVQADPFEYLAPAKQAKLVVPASLTAAATWTQVATEKIDSGVGLSAKEMRTLSAILAAAKRTEPLNSFWPQAEAAILGSQSSEQEPVSLWLRSANLTEWNDHQSARLLDIKQRLASSSNARLSWHSAYAYFARSQSPSRQISRFGRRMVSRVDFTSERGVSIRYATIRNGNLMRANAKSVATGDIGSQLVDIAAYPSELVTGSRPKRLYLGRNLVANSLRAAGRGPDADDVLEIFQNNDGWSALVQRPDPTATARRLTLYSVLCAAVPQACLFLIGIGLAFGLIGSGLVEVAQKHTLPRYSAVAAALILAGVTYYFTRGIAAPISMFLCSLLTLLQPTKLRSKLEGDAESSLGLLFQVAVFLISASVATAILGSLVLSSLAGYALLQRADFVSHLHGDGMVALQAALILASSLFLIPFWWAYVQKIATLRVLSLSLKRFGWNLVGFGMVSAAIAGPVCFAIDRSLEDTWTKLLTNEPVYYLQQ